MSVKQIKKSNSPNHRYQGWWWRSLVRATLAVGAGLFLIFALGQAQRWGWLTSDSGHHHSHEAQGADVVYVCPMMCTDLRSPVPGNCPVCGMPLEPVKEGAQNQDPYAIRIEPVARRLAHITTAPVERKALFKTIRAPGSLTFDETRMATIVTYTEGRIEKQFTNYTGIKIEKGSKLVKLFSPRLEEAQVSFLETRRTLTQMNGSGVPGAIRAQRALVGQSRRQLIELGMTEDQVKELERTGEVQTRITIHSPIPGTVIKKQVREGEEVKRGQELYQIADLSTLWLMLNLFPDDAAKIHYGQKVKAEVRSLPGETYQGRVAFVNPVIDKETRTVQVRVEMPNPNGKLRVGDYATAQITVPLGEQKQIYDKDLAGKWISPMHPQIIRDQKGTCPICDMPLVSSARYGFTRDPIAHPTHLVVPRSAVLRVGSRSVVYVETEPGRFEIRPVKVKTVTQEDAVIAEPVSRPFFEFYPMLQALEIPGYLPFSAPGLNGMLPHAITQPWDALLGGVREGEQVAVSGNFLIDSQMQLAGKPSLIDTSRLRIDVRNLEIQESLDQLTPGERAAAARQEICPVTQAKLGSMGKPLKVIVEGREVFICCKGCAKPLKKRPKAYLPYIAPKKEERE